ncbi:hypothetical protein KQY30_20550 [Streptomyces sp. GMY02]|uniref:hypothetical protein n=1 Tax=Streptomyces sp. GMY02 TaxID=1333528 RepID=UPI001C2C8599|nr:hypothetical protein [Streptomyces sp. GMY02]QXE36275.1 hypothetical protein KQY30_20550 [Streptomyces sp. GMY02]
MMDSLHRRTHRTKDGSCRAAGTTRGAVARTTPGIRGLPYGTDTGAARRRQREPVTQAARRGQLGGARGQREPVTQAARWRRGPVAGADSGGGRKTIRPSRPR